VTARPHSSVGSFFQAFLAFQAAKVEQCSTFETSEAFGGSVSQSNHMPVQALANQTAACVSGAGDSCDWLLVELQTRPLASFCQSRCVDGP